MGTFLTVSITLIIIGYTAWTLKGMAKSAKAGTCSGCSHCPASERCGERKE